MTALEKPHVADSLKCWDGSAQAVKHAAQQHLVSRQKGTQRVRRWDFIFVTWTGKSLPTLSLDGLPSLELASCGGISIGFAVLADCDDCDGLSCCGVV